MTKKRGYALIVGFVGRCNSGDELMLEMHRETLQALGFERIQVWTEFPGDATTGRYPLRWEPRHPYELVVIGGGGLDVGYGFYPLSIARFRYGATIVVSSVNLPSSDDRYLRALNELCDCVITRKQMEHSALKTKMPRLHFLPDISTTYVSPVPRTVDRIAMVLRADAAPLLKFAPADEFDVLVLSEWDTAASRKFAEQYGAPLRELWAEDPRVHVDVLRSYRRVVSVGRFHAALYAADYGRDMAYLYPTQHQQQPEDSGNLQGRAAWERIVEVGEAHAAETKVGLLSTELANYGRATKEQYLELFRAAMNGRETGGTVWTNLQP